ncbi:MAG: TIGR03905 family TSCPD domain-containing protein [Clostridia bacterium]|nr:TIGR03905 family TSCPD domain-containing protein [Clostridia bacterium]
MERVIDYTTRGTCSRAIHIVMDGDTIKEVQFMGGCHGNTQGVAALVAGMDANEAIKRLRGIKCGMKSTSCPDQLAVALTQALENA